MVDYTCARKLVAAVAAASSSIAAGQGQEGPGKLEEVLVTGSVIERGIPSDINALPVQVLTRQQFDYTPAESVADFLHELPSVGAGNSIYQDEYSGGDSSVNLRGAGPQYTLVVVNGRRFGGEDTPDIGALPPEAVGNMEVLKTGSSAIYGSDAVAGVINIKLRDDFEGFQVNATYGAPTTDYDPDPAIADIEDVLVGRGQSGDGSNARIGTLFGFKLDRLSFTGSFTYQDFEGFARNDRALTATRDRRRFGGPDRRSTYYGHPHRVILADGTEVNIDTDRFEPGYVPTSPADFVPFSGDRRYLSSGEQGVAPPMERYSGHWSASFELNESARLYSFGYYDQREQVFVSNEPRFDSVLAADNPNNVFGEEVFVVSSLNPDQFGYMNEEFDVTNYQATVGIEGKIGERWNYDLSLSDYDKTIEEFYQNDSTGTRVQQQVDLGNFNPLCYYCTSDETFANMTLSPSYEERNELQSFDITIGGDLFVYAAGTVAAAVGYQRRESNFSFTPDEVWLREDADFWWYGSIDAPTSGSRDVDAYFAEVVLPVYQGASDSLVTSAELTGAIRREEYSDFGKADVAQLLGRLALFDEQLIIRAGYAESFRAPDLVQLNDPVISEFFTGGLFFDPVRGGFLSYTEIRGGNVDLGPEEGESINLGIILRPDFIPGLYVSIDRWELEISGVIREPNVQGLFDGTETVGTIVRDPVTLEPTLDLRLDNGGLRELAGWDFALNYPIETELGDFEVFGNATLMTKFEDSNAGVTTDFLGEYDQGVGAVPEWRFAGGVNWRRQGWDAGFGLHYFDGWRDTFEPLDIDRELDGTWMTDLQVGYNFGFADPEGVLSGLRVFAGVENMFNEKPQFTVESPDGWDRFFSDLRGRYVYGGIRMTF